jgi:hypothetical protein
MRKSVQISANMVCTYLLGLPIMYKNLRYDTLTIYPLLKSFTERCKHLIPPENSAGAYSVYFLFLSCYLVADHSVGFGDSLTDTECSGSNSNDDSASDDSVSDSEEALDDGFVWSNGVVSIDADVSSTDEASTADSEPDVAHINSEISDSDHTKVISNSSATILPSGKVCIDSTLDYACRPKCFEQVPLYLFHRYLHKVPFDKAEFHFLDRHPQYRKYGLQFRSAPVIPSIAYQFPNPDTNSNKTVRPHGITHCSHGCCRNLRIVWRCTLCFVPGGMRPLWRTWLLLILRRIRLMP